MPPLPPALRAVTPREVSQRLQAERGGAPFLLHLDGEGRQRIVELTGEVESLTIGRQPDSAVALTWDTEVSRLHAVLERAGGDWTLSDEGLSRNGSYVNDRRLRGKHRLCDGDAIRIGTSVLIFRAGRQADVPTTMTATEHEPPELSPAQLRVLVALCAPAEDGTPAGPRSNREIAEELFLSVETVKSHLHVLFEVFDLTELPQNRKRVELVRRAAEAGVLRAAVR